MNGMALSRQRDAVLHLVGCAREAVHVVIFICWEVNLQVAQCYVSWKYSIPEER